MALWRSSTRQTTHFNLDKKGQLKDNFKAERLNARLILLFAVQIDFYAEIIIRKKIIRTPILFRCSYYSPVANPLKIDTFSILKDRFELMHSAIFKSKLYHCLYIYSQLHFEEI